MVEKILIVSPHPDDETLGAGGSLLRYKAQGAETYWLNITNMRPEFGYSTDEIATWEHIKEQVQQGFGFTHTIDLQHVR